MNLNLIRLPFKNIIFDFDGVILDSVPIKSKAFRHIFQDFDKELVDQILEYHELNGGLSRYKKIEYFFKSVLKRPITEEKVIKYADKFSEITNKELIDSKYIIKDVLDFIKNNKNIYNMHIASGSSHNDLKYICEKLDLSKYFISIDGSPMEKSLLVENILIKYGYKEEDTCLVGDSINDYDAASHNNIAFCGYNNKNLNKVSYHYIDLFDDILQD